MGDQYKVNLEQPHVDERIEGVCDPIILRLISLQNKDLQDGYKKT